MVDIVEHVFGWQLHKQFLLPLQWDLCRTATWDGLEHIAVRANRGVFQLLQGPQHALAAAGAAPMEGDQYRSLHMWPVTAKVESNTHEQP